MGECVWLYLPSIPGIVWLPCPNNVNAPSQSSPRSCVVFIDPKKRRENTRGNIFAVVLNWGKHCGLQTTAFLLETVRHGRHMIPALSSSCVFILALYVKQRTVIWFKCYDWKDGKKSAIFSNCSPEWNWFTPNWAWNNIGRWHCCYCAWNNTILIGIISTFLQSRDTHAGPYL